MELLSPAGNLEKLRYAFHYGADAVYIGLHGFSLRTRADNFGVEDFAELRRIKGNRRLYCALNVYFFDQDIDRLKQTLDRVEDGLFDAFIVSDPGVVKLLQRRFPGTELHLSTQANCTNAEAARVYRDMGFSRIVPARELSLKQIGAIKQAVPEMEIEAFVHGAMCLAYSGRCFLSQWMSDRSANRGDCAHSCRWAYRPGLDPLVLEEEKRPGEYYPLIEGEGFTELLSSRDICMIDHLGAMRDAGIDSLKIEGRMKSVYYTALVTRSYRKALDTLTPRVQPTSGVAQSAVSRSTSDSRSRADSLSREQLSAFTAELEQVSHRDYTTGFYFGRDEIDRPAERGYRRAFLFLGTVEERVSDRRYRIVVKNAFSTGQAIQYLGPHTAAIDDSAFRLLDPELQPVEQVIHHGEWLLETDCPVEPGFLIRTTLSDGKPA